HVPERAPALGHDARGLDPRALLVAALREEVAAPFRRQVEEAPERRQRVHAAELVRRLHGTGGVEGARSAVGAEPEHRSARLLRAVALLEAEVALQRRGRAR